jgi:hypothetical protein
MRLQDELRHLQTGVQPEDTVEGAGLLIFKISCQGNVEAVLKKARETLGVVLQEAQQAWPTEDRWRATLPKWFVEICAPELTEEEEEENLRKWRELSVEEQQREEQEEKWSVMDWISWFEPGEPFEQRAWFWWDAFIVNPSLLLVVVEVLDFPVPLGSLFWLFRASGAVKIEEAEKEFMHQLNVVQ